MTTPNHDTVEQLALLEDPVPHVDRVNRRAYGRIRLNRRTVENGKRGTARARAALEGRAFDEAEQSIAS